MTAKTTAQALPAVYTLKHHTRYSGPVLCLLTDLSGQLPKADLRHKLFL